MLFRSIIGLRSLEATPPAVHPTPPPPVFPKPPIIPGLNNVLSRNDILESFKDLMVAHFNRELMSFIFRLLVSFILLYIIVDARVL